MEFTIEASCTPNSKLLKEYPCLSNFKFYEKEEPIRDFEWYMNKGKIMRQPVARIKKIPKICIDSLDDLVNLMQMTKMPIIIDSDYTIEIYDGYRE